MSECAACDALGRDDKGAARLCATHRRRNLRAIATIRALHAGDPRWRKPAVSHAIMPPMSDTPTEPVDPEPAEPDEPEPEPET